MEWSSFHEDKTVELSNHVKLCWLGQLGCCFSLPSNPWTRDGQVRANIVGIAPRVSGPIIHVGVRDNQEVKKGDLLFEIDPEDFQAQVNLSTLQASFRSLTFWSAYRRFL